MDYAKFYKDNQELFDNLNKVIMDQEFAPVKEVYFDLCTLKDFIRKDCFLKLSLGN